MSHHDEYRQWPFLTDEEFDLACAFLDRNYMGTKLGAARKSFKLRCCRIATTGTSYIEILRLLQPPDDEDDLAAAFAQLGVELLHSDIPMEMEMVDEEDEAALQQYPDSTFDLPPQYSTHSEQPYVKYEIHLHPTYRLPTLWITLHDLPKGESAFDLNSVYRYLVPDQYKSRLQEAGLIGGISAAPHPVTCVPSFFIHPCQTKEAMEKFDCSQDNYLILWLGLVGGCVGLWVPLEMAEQSS